MGCVLNVRIGEQVQPDDTLCTLYARNDAEADKAAAAIRAAITFSEEPAEASEAMKQYL